ncbi:MAG: AmmeMemoRadiSam system protein A [Anaerolineae bacterium]|nr:AmmeMemoRadiSam system protein A [Anaerolineae bacterium]NIN97464.1 AmmeMemoRadiSam system protein A [Anaerolineae bacterium]NIQ80393.1 AmmeMemoRadiSam system protein A [Anaerolineae bacterium]
MRPRKGGGEMSNPHALVKLARETIESYIGRNKIVNVPPEEELTAEMRQRAGVFVSIKKKGQLRGCIGTIDPREENVAQEIIHNAISAATRDPRFPPIGPEELDELDISVDVLTTPEPVESIDELDPKRYGLIVESRANPLKRGLLLPDLPSIGTAEEQFHHTKVYKAGIVDDEEPIQMYRFEVIRYE